MNQTIKEAMEKTLSMASDKGIDQADVIVSGGESFSLSAQGGDIDKYKVCGSKVLGIRSIKDNKIGLSYTEAFDDESLEIAVQKSLENAMASQERPNEQITVKDEVGEYPTQYGPDKSTNEEKIAFTLELEAAVKNKEKRVTAVPYNGFSEVTSEGYYMNSLNSFNYESEYYVSCYTSALVKEGQKNSMHYQSDIARNFKSLNPAVCVDESIEHAVNWLSADSLPTNYYDVIFDLDAFSSFFGCFGSIYSGKGAMDKVNPFADKVNTQIMSEKISLWDKPRFEQSFFPSHYDSEGIMQQDLCLIENGHLKTFYHNSATANFFNLETNARAARGAKSALGVSGTTKVISPADTTESDLKSGEYLEVISMQGLHSGASSYSGEFSFAASGYLCRDGQRVKPVNGVTVSGNFYKMMKDVQLVGDQLRSTHHKDFFAPLIRFEKISVGGE